MSSIEVNGPTWMVSNEQERLEINFDDFTPQFALSLIGKTCLQLDTNSEWRLMGLLPRPTWYQIVEIHYTSNPFEHFDITLNFTNYMEKKKIKIKYLGEI